MLTKQYKIWLLQKYPGLVVDTNDKQLSGEVEFTGTYNEQSGRFLQIEKDTNDGVGGLRLSGQFKITIKTRADFRDSKLPALFLEGFNHIPGRHFNQSDFSGCICNPLEEDEFLEPRFEFQRYFKELVAPFLYGQLFFTQEDRWPWFEYAHGGLGLLEAFSKNPTLEKAEECIKKKSRELYLWSQIKPLLLQKSNIKGHTLCPCSKHDQIRRCHPLALTGLRLLKEQIKKNNITLP